MIIMHLLPGAALAGGVQGSGPSPPSHYQNDLWDSYKSDNFFMLRGRGVREWPSVVTDQC